MLFSGCLFSKTNMSIKTWSFRVNLIDLDSYWFAFGRSDLPLAGASMFHWLEAPLPRAFVTYLTRVSWSYINIRTYKAQIFVSYRQVQFWMQPVQLRSLSIMIAPWRSKAFETFERLAYAVLGANSNWFSIWGRSGKLWELSASQGMLAIWKCFNAQRLWTWKLHTLTQTHLLCVSHFCLT